MVSAAIVHQTKRASPLGTQRGRMALLGAIGLIGMMGAAIIPAYQDWQVRTGVQAGLVAVAGATRAIEQTLRERGAADMSNPELTGWRAGVLPEGVVAIEVERSGKVTVRFTGPHGVEDGDRVQVKVVPTADGRVLDLSMPGLKTPAVSWRCADGPGGTTLNRKYLPKSCPQPYTIEEVKRWYLISALVGLFALLVGGAFFVAFSTSIRDGLLDLAFVLFMCATVAVVLVIGSAVIRLLSG